MGSTVPLRSFVGESGQQAGLPDARLTAKDDDLSLTTLHRTIDGRQQHRQLVNSIDQWRWSTSPRHSIPSPTVLAQLTWFRHES
ncbi:hypothetical protein ACFQ9R_03995 [Nocardia sp. NPDC056541]|uniref:hypothetical protein n=1 Tax=Nocardia sp. NPDC056541 TaxID=3345860 RepID=UPI00367064F1